MFRFKTVDSSIHPSILKMMGAKDINMSEMGLMKYIQYNSRDSFDNIYMSDMPENLYITKAAISQALSSLERKGYINRESDKANRRKQILTLTESGAEITKKADASFERLYDMIFERMGEEDVSELIALFNRFADIVDDIKSSI
jgi:DNA-binding MarR family transcriptional regulator